MGDVARHDEERRECCEGGAGGFQCGHERESDHAGRDRYRGPCRRADLVLHSDGDGEARVGRDHRRLQALPRLDRPLLERDSGRAQCRLERRVGRCERLFHVLRGPGHLGRRERSGWPVERSRERRQLRVVGNPVRGAGRRRLVHHLRGPSHFRGSGRPERDLGRSRERRIHRLGRDQERGEHSRQLVHHLRGTGFRRRMDRNQGRPLGAEYPIHRRVDGD